MQLKPDDPIARFLQDAERAKVGASFDPSRAALATSSLDGIPSVRYVLVKWVDERGFRIFTNYTSRKARFLDENPRASLAFHWENLGEQVRVEGHVERLSEEESDAYFAARPRGSKIGAWASPQSHEIASRDELIALVSEAEKRFEGVEVIPRPSFWGGYLLIPEKIEFWFDGDDRLHDRFLYTREGEGYRCRRLAP